VPAFSALAWRDARRNPAQWALFALVPVVFILGSEVVTPNKPIILNLEEHGRRIMRSLPMSDVHAATMAPLAVASLAALIGLFVLFDGRDSDHRVALVGLEPNALLGARLGVRALTAASMATTALVFQATRWPTYVAANILIAITYALVGAWLAKIFGRVGGVFMAFLLPFLDLGIVQNPMLHPTPTTLSRWLPGYGGSQVLVYGAFDAQAVRRRTSPRRRGGAAAVRSSHVRAVQSGGGRVRTERSLLDSGPAPHKEGTGRAGRRPD